MLGAYASFGLAAVIGITYVLQFKEIKAKHLHFFFTRLPSLQVLDVMNSRAVFIGWLLMTVGLAVGRAVDRPGAGDLRRRIRGCRRCRWPIPKIFVALITWAVYTFALVARRAIGWRGQALRVSVGRRLRDRAAELRAGQLLPDRQSQLSLTCISC